MIGPDIPIEETFRVPLTVATPIANLEPGAIQTILRLADGQMPTISPITLQQQQYREGFDNFVTGTYPAGSESKIFALDVKEPSLVTRSFAKIFKRPLLYRVRTAKYQTGY